MPISGYPPRRIGSIPPPGGRASPWQLLPHELVAQAVQQQKPLFLESFRDTPLLLVRLPKVDDPLALGLSGASTVTGAPLVANPDTLAFATTTTHMEEISARLRSRDITFGPSKLRIRLRGLPYFAVPMRKRPDAGKAYTHRLSVGRARNNDIVLREASVSKFHAWFERDDNGHFFLADGRSKNTTKLNGVTVRSLHMERLYPGDEVHFGSVETTFCPADIFWEALQEA
jgi:hypothetical protein